MNIALGSSLIRDRAVSCSKFPYIILKHDFFLGLFIINQDIVLPFDKNIHIDRNNVPFFSQFHSNCSFSWPRWANQNAFYNKSRFRNRCLANNLKNPIFHVFDWLININPMNAFDRMWVDDQLLIFNIFLKFSGKITSRKSLFEEIFRSV